MSDLAATNCGCGCDNNGGSCGCNCGCGCGGFGNNNCLFLILILLCCGGCGGGCFDHGCGGNNCDCLIWILLLCCCCGGGGFADGAAQAGALRRAGAAAAKPLQALTLAQHIAACELNARRRAFFFLPAQAGTLRACGFLTVGTTAFFAGVRQQYPLVRLCQVVLIS